MQKKPFSDKIEAYKRRKTIRKFYQINQYIKADKIRVIGEKGEQLGILSRDEALFKARQAEKDLVLVAEKADPPVAKIVDFKKFKYLESKKEQAGKKKTKQQDLKEFRFTPFIAPNDFAVRIKRAHKVLENGDKVKLTVKFVGRQITRKEFGQELLNKAVKELADISRIEAEPKLQGRLLSIVLKPTPLQKSK